MVKNLPPMHKTQPWSLGWEDPLEKGTATHSSILACRIPWTEEPGRLHFMGWQTVRHDWTTKHAHTHTHIHAHTHTCYNSLPGLLSISVYWFILILPVGFPGGSVVKNSSAKQKMQVWSLGQEDPLQKEMATPLVFLPGKPHRPRSLAGYSPWGCKESGTHLRDYTTKRIILRATLWGNSY